LQDFTDAEMNGAGFPLLGTGNSSEELTIQPFFILARVNNTLESRQNLPEFEIKTPPRRATACQIHGATVNSSHEQS